VFCSAFLLFFFASDFLDVHLAELLSTARRWRDLIATGNAAGPVATLWNQPWSYTSSMRA
jgi:hypothetical protein